MMQKIAPVVALVIAVSLGSVHGQTFTFSFGQPSRNGNEATDGALSSTTDIQVPVVITIDPPDAFLSADTIVMVSVSGGSATLGLDFNLSRTEVTFDVGANNGNVITVFVDVLDDPLVEGTESFILSGAISTTTAAPGSTFVGGDVTVTILDDDVAICRFAQSSYSQSGSISPLPVRLVFDASSGTTTQQIIVQITASTQGGDTATEGADFTRTTCSLILPAGGRPGDLSGPCDIPIINDRMVEQDETFSLSARVINTNGQPARFTVGGDSASATIIDDDIPDPCSSNPCDPNAMCERIGLTADFTCTCIPPYTGDGFTCTRVVMDMGDDPHFSIVLPSGKVLCYTVQGEHGFAFNLITNKKLYMNAMFVPDSRRKEVTWLGSIGVVVPDSHYQGSNMTRLKFDVDTKEVHIGEKVTLKAKNIDELTFRNGKLTISEAPPKTRFRYPAVKVNLKDAEMSFTIKFTGNHLDMFWHHVGERMESSHGLIGQFFRKGVEVDTVRKLLILPGKEPVPVMRRPVWSFMEREVADDQLCWTAMNPGYQGEGLIDGTYFNYLVNDVLSTNFKFKPKGYSYPNGNTK